MFQVISCFASCHTLCYMMLLCVNNYIRPTVNHLEGSLYLHRTDHCFLVAVQKM